jgi:DNA-binding transcriptional MocR family regulator
MKEQTLVEMKNKIEALIRVLQQTVEEQQHLTTLASGIFATIKLMPGYDDAIANKLLRQKLPKNRYSKKFLRPFFYLIFFLIM